MRRGCVRSSWRRVVGVPKLMETINPDPPPKPCEYFQMIGGTSTGGCVLSTVREGDNTTDWPRLMAIMLGRLRMDIDACMDAYVLLFD